MGKAILRFFDTEIGKDNLYHHKSPNFWEDGDIEKVLVSNKISSSKKIFKCFIGYLHYDYEVELLYEILPTTCSYVKSNDVQTKWMFCKWRWWLITKI